MDVTTMCELVICFIHMTSLLLCEASRLDIFLTSLG